MATDLDPNDPIGARLRELPAPDTDVSADRAWAGVEQHRRTRRTRHLVAALGTTFVVLVVAVAAFAATQSGDGGRHVQVVTPPTEAPPTETLAGDPRIFEMLPMATATQLTVTPTGPILAGTEIEVRLAPTPHKVADTINTQMQMCFRWRDYDAIGETCDPSVDVRYVDTDDAGISTYRVKVPGWVRTAAGPRSCQAFGCRLAMSADDGTRIGTTLLDIVSDVAPNTNTQLVSVGADGVVRFTHDGMEPHESWTRYAAAVDKESLGAGYTAICAFTHRLLCDSIVRAAEPKLDGQKHTVDVATNRLLHTPEGWIDCVEYTCAVVVYRTVDVYWNENSTASGQEVIGIVPYQLPSDTPAMKTPTMTVTPTAGVHNKDVVTVTIRDLPPNVDPMKWRELGGVGQCAAVDLRMIDDCSYSTQTTYTELPNNSLRVEYPVRTCFNGPKCYIALQAGGKGYPELARTERFEVLP